MEPAVIESTGRSKGEGIGNSVGFDLENPFGFKFGQVFTGFGFGCGVGIGVGRPIYLGEKPVRMVFFSLTALVVPSVHFHLCDYANLGCMLLNNEISLTHI